MKKLSSAGGESDMRRKINIVEVGPRDGFQNLCTYIPVADKLHFIDGLANAGIRHIQITSFVSPKAIPQMKDASEVAKIAMARHPDLDMFALVPNLRGAQTAHDVGIKKVTNVISLSETHNKANIRRTHEESFTELAKIKESFPDMSVGVDVATAFGCPFEGHFPTANLLKFIERAHKLGVREFTLCDTTGMSNPAQVREVVNAVKPEYQDCVFQVHIHDTRNMGMVNSLAAIEAGIDYVQSTLGGLGGCPFAPGASGNTSTEDLVNMLNEMGFETGIDLPALIDLAKEEKGKIPDGIFSGHLININK